MIKWLNCNAAAVQAITGLISVIATVALVLITSKYVRLTHTVADAATKARLDGMAPIVTVRCAERDLKRYNGTILQWAEPGWPELQEFERSKFRWLVAIQVEVYGDTPAVLTFHHPSWGESRSIWSTNDNDAHAPMPIPAQNVIGKSGCRIQARGSKVVYFWSIDCEHADLKGFADQETVIAMSVEPVGGSTTDRFEWTETWRLDVQGERLHRTEGPAVMRSRRQYHGA